ncbi:tetratricopeptide repeat protein [Celeribacter sp. HF31]|uniref:tetratricopeptide repeat protein n=1 Tax=Celeribacter sp. HF31 TaxID=2721558 RepID=UPI00143040E4|nr:tetratricopeptide repeat protein [Celeribacter sp. HF31]NIY80718.1 tetratricopeptide repeat protein [Celeribacter sp. HF31]
MLPDVQKREILRQEVTKILESNTFARSKANRALLMYLAEEFFSGRGDGITEYGIAHELLGRDSDFDPSTDPIVRVRMRRLREAIVAYYDQNPDSSDRLNIPRGSYALSLSLVNPPPRSEVPANASVTDVSAEMTPPQAPRQDTPSPGDAAPEAPPQSTSRQALPQRPRRMFWGVMGVVILIFVFVAVVLGYGIWRNSSPVAEIQPQIKTGYPVIAIAPFVNLTGAAENDVYEKDVQRQLAGDFQRFGRLRVRVLGADLTREIAGSDYVLRGSVLNLVGELDLAVELAEAETGKVLFQSRISGPIKDADFYASLRDVSRRISAYLAAQGGVISAFGQPRAEASGAMGDMFYCVLLTDAFLESYSPDQFQAAYRCFEPLRAQFETDAVGAAAFGTLMLHAVPEFHFMDPSKIPARMYSTPQEVTEYADALVDRFPSTDVSFILLGAIYNAKGDTSLAIRTLRQAVELNPANPTAYSVLSYAYLSADLLDASASMAQSAVRLSASPSAYMYLPILVVGIVRKNARMVDIARKGYAKQESPSRDILLLAAAAMIGDRPEVERLARLVGHPEDPMANIRMYVQGDVALAAIARHLEAAGVEVPAPSCLSSASGNVSRGLNCDP